MTRNISRRRFLRSSALAGATIPYFHSLPVAFANISANDRPRIGCIGVGSKGTDDARGHRLFGDIVAVCDVDQRHAERAQNDPKIGDGKADTYADYRRVLDRRDIDVVSIATPDHWHTKIAVEALEAGKHVFCQKPLTLTLEENEFIRQACRKHPRLVFCVGTQQRADQTRFLRAVNMVQKGLLGSVRRVTVGINASPTGGPFPIETPPPELDWNMWLGQAPAVPFREKRCHYQFRWWYDYSGGKFTDWGAHHVDIATWALNLDGEQQGPTEIDGSEATHPVAFSRGYPTVDDCYNTSHDFAVKCSYLGGIEVVVTSRGDNGILFEGSKGRLFVNRGRIAGVPIEENWDAGHYDDADRQRLFKGKPAEEHKANFFRCLREGGLPVSDVFTHTQALATCHLCAIAARLGRTIAWDPHAQRILGDDEAANFSARTPRRGFEISQV